MSSDADALACADAAAQNDFPTDDADQPTSSCHVQTFTLTVDADPSPEVTLSVKVIPPEPPAEG